MAAIDIFSKIELPQKEVFKYFVEANTFKRCVSPFFTIENLSSSNWEQKNLEWLSNSTLLQDFV